MNAWVLHPQFKFHAEARAALRSGGGTARCIDFGVGQLDEHWRFEYLPQQSAFLRTPPLRWISLEQQLQIRLGAKQFVRSANTAGKPHGCAQDATKIYYVRTVPKVHRPRRIKEEISRW